MKYLNYCFPIQDSYEIRFNTILKNPRIVHAMFLADSNQNYDLIRVNCDILQTADFNNYLDDILFTSTNKTNNLYHSLETSLENTLQDSNKVFIEKHYCAVCRSNVSQCNFFLTDKNNNLIKLSNQIYIFVKIVSD